MNGLDTFFLYVDGNPVEASTNAMNSQLTSEMRGVELDIISSS